MNILEKRIIKVKGGRIIKVRSNQKRRNKMLFRKKEDCLFSVGDGEAVPITEIPDEVFSEGILGIGYAVKLKNGIIVSPVDGIVEVIASTGHAYTVKTGDGTQILIHIGVDTVSLGGVGFKSFVSEGQKVKVGDVLCHADIEYVASKGFSTITAVLIADSDEIEKIKYEYGKTVGGKTPVMYYRRKG